MLCQVFKGEPYLDKHMQRKHVDRIPEVGTESGFPALPLNHWLCKIFM